MNEQQTKKQGMGNSGFSLVELIIVIAIMAILVGVLAPSLLRYVEKTNVSADTQLADAVKTAVLTAMMDPTVLNSTDKSATTFAAAHTAMASIDTTCSGEFAKSVAATLGATSPTGINAFLLGKMKSVHASGAEIQVQVTGENSVAVQITGTDAAGGKDTSGSGTLIQVK